MPEYPSFAEFFQGNALSYLNQSIALSLQEDEQDLTSIAVFSQKTMAYGQIVSKQKTIVTGLPITALVFAAISENSPSEKTCAQVTIHAEEGQLVTAGTVIAEIKATATALLRAERVILNFIGHMCGVSNLTRQYVKLLQGSKTTLLDTRKTLPGMRYPQKYAVLTGGGRNHRLNLSDMLMLKDNHIDQAGSITKAVKALRDAYCPCPPLEVECRTEKEVLEAVNLKVDRIMLDNMPVTTLAEVLSLIPKDIETEVSGGVNLNNIQAIAKAGPDFVSVGRLTHSAANADLSMKINLHN